eukprot:2608202-Pleurochrysis_carterae.AAC.1
MSGIFVHSTGISVLCVCSLQSDGFISDIGAHGGLSPEAEASFALFAEEDEDEDEDVRIDDDDAATL